MKKIFKKIDEIVLFTLLIIPTFITIQHFGGYGLELPRNLIAWNLIFVLIAIKSIEIIRSGSISFSKNTSSFLIFFLIIFFSFLINFNESKNGIYIILGIISSFLLFTSIQQIKINKYKIFIVLIIIGLIHSMIGVAQFFQLNIITDFLNITKQERIGSTFGYANSYATYLSLVVGLVGVLSVENKISNKLFFLLITILAFGIFISLSRTGIFSFILIMASVVYLKRKDRLFVCICVSITLAMFFILLIAIKYYSGSLSNDNYLSTLLTILNEKKFIMDPVRGDLYLSAVKIFIDNWSTGIGYGNFTDKYFHFLREIEIQNPAMIKFIFIHPHNEILYWSIMGGFLGLVGIIFFCIEIN